VCWAAVAALVRHVMYHGATAEEGRDAAQTAFAEAFGGVDDDPQPAGVAADGRGPGLPPFGGAGDAYRLPARPPGPAVGRS
jgi:hypothetical protein